MINADVPTPIDFRDAQHAGEWERTAQARPGRAEIFETFSRELQRLGNGNLVVLDLGSGPGFLAAHLLDVMPNLQLTLLDFSAAMHDLARQRLGSVPSTCALCIATSEMTSGRWDWGYSMWW